MSLARAVLATCDFLFPARRSSGRCLSPARRIAEQVTVPKGTGDVVVQMHAQKHDLILLRSLRMAKKAGTAAVACAGLAGNLPQPKRVEYAFPTKTSSFFKMLPVLPRLGFVASPGYAGLLPLMCFVIGSNCM